MFFRMTKFGSIFAMMDHSNKSRLCDIFPKFTPICNLVKEVRACNIFITTCFRIPYGFPSKNDSSLDEEIDVISIGS